VPKIVKAVIIALTEVTSNKIIHIVKYLVINESVIINIIMLILRSLGRLAIIKRLVINEFHIINIMMECRLCII